jgi:hypothetical protein
VIKGAGGGEREEEEEEERGGGGGGGGVCVHARASEGGGTDASKFRTSPVLSAAGEHVLLMYMY